MRKKLLSALLQLTPGRQLTILLLCFACVLNSQAQTWNYAYGFGNAQGESARGVATDASGNTYFIGQFGGTENFDPLGSPAGSLTAQNADIVVVKYNATGAFQWAVKGGGTGTDNGFAIATDGTNVYITGTFQGTAVFGPFSLTTTGGTDVVVAKLSAATGTYAWATKVGSTTGDGVSAICIDGGGNPYIVGNYSGSMTLGSTTIAPNGGGGTTDLYIAKFNTADGTPAWLSGGGAFASGDGGLGGGICYVPGLNEVVVASSYFAASATYGALPQVPNLGDNDIIILELNAGTGAFLSAVPVSTPTEEGGTAIAYDAFTQDVFFTGLFDNASITFGSITLTGNGTDEIFAARYDPDANTFVWAVNPTGGAELDRGNTICSNGTGLIAIAGQFENSVTFGTTTLTSTSGNFADIFVAGLSANEGSWQWAVQSGGTSGAVDDVARGISSGGPLQKLSVAGQFAGTATFGPISLTSSGSADLFVAQFTPPLTATTSTTPPSCANGCNGTASVVAMGGIPPYTYSWSPSGGSGTTATGLCVGTYTVTITDNAGTSIQRTANVALPATQLASANTSNPAFPINANNTNIYDAACNLIAKLVPNGASPVSGNVSAKVWIEPGVPVYPAGGTPYVARHYELMPAIGAATATALVTLYFTQAEFDAFNAHPGSQLDLPTGPTDNANKANVRFTKFAGTSNDNTGLPGSYTGASVVIDPVDANIVWNATLSRWEISFNVTGFSGFFLQTSQISLPVTWLSLNGSINAQGQPVFYWKVQEQHVASYTIERSVGGAPFTPVATIDAKGDGEREYQFQELSVLAGKATYRIKQTDINGRYTYSRSILLQRNRDGWITLYPNPVKGAATLNVTDKELLNTTARLYDGTGREVQRIQITQSVTTLQLQQHQAGVYTLRFQNGHTIRILKE